MLRYIARGKKPTRSITTEIEIIEGSNLFYINLSEEEAKNKEADYFLRKLDDNIDYEKRKTAIKSSYVQILFLVCLGLFIIEQVGILPSALLLSGQIVYISIAALTLIPVLLASWHCIKKILEKENAGLYLLTLCVIWIGFLFSLAVVIYPALFLSIGILPLFSLPLATISALTVAHYYDAIAVDKVLKQWCNMANTKIAELAFQTFELCPEEKSDAPIQKIKFEEIKENNILKIEPGMHIPVNGLIVANPDTKDSHHESDQRKIWKIDESVITGESVAQERGIGRDLKGGSKNVSSDTLYLKTNQTGQAVLEKRIANFNRYSHKEKSQSDPGNYAAFLFMALLLLGITATVLLWFFLGPAPVLPYILLQSLSVLNCFSPCMVAIAQMLPLYLSRGALFKNDILITDEGLKNMREINMVVFDKTGTLTGEPSVHNLDFSKSADLKEDEILKLVASLQNLYKDKNTYARAFCAHAKQNHYYTAEKDQKATGKVRGASGFVKYNQAKKHILCGSLDYIVEACGDQYPNLAATIKADKYPQDKTLSFIVIDGVYHGWVSFESSVRPDAKASIQALQGRGIKVLMLTGDSNKNVAKKIAIEAGILEEKDSHAIESKEKDEEKNIDEKVYYDNQNKEEFIQRLKKDNPKARILMVGDGVNDGGALQAAHIGLSITDLADAVQYAVGSLRGKLIEIDTLIKISLKMDSHIQSNVWSLLATTALSMLIAAGISYPILGFLLAPTLASIVGSVIALFSLAVLLYNYYNLTTYLEVEFADKPAKTPKPVSLISPRPLPYPTSSLELMPQPGGLLSPSSQPLTPHKLTVTPYDLTHSV